MRRNGWPPYWLTNRTRIHLLRVLMDAEHIANGMIMWYQLLHLTFVVSSSALVAIDRMSRNGSLS